MNDSATTVVIKATFHFIAGFTGEFGTIALIKVLPTLESAPVYLVTADLMGLHIQAFYVSVQAATTAFLQQKKALGRKKNIVTDAETFQEQAQAEG